MGSAATRQAILGLALAACHHAPPPVADPPAQPPPPVVAPDTVSRPPARAQETDRALTSAERETLIAEVRVRRAAWQARGIIRYQIRVAVGCFCPWPKEPRILEVRDGKAVALYDTTGRPAGPVREPWSTYTVEGLFDVVERLARTADVVGVRYDSSYGYPTAVNGDQRLGRFDDWFWVRATNLTARH